MCFDMKYITKEKVILIYELPWTRCRCGYVLRKKILLKKRAKGKRQMKAMGKVVVLQEVFMAVLKLSQTP